MYRKNTVLNALKNLPIAADGEVVKTKRYKTLPSRSILCI